MLDREPSPPGSNGPDDMAGAPLPEPADLWDLSNVNRDVAPDTSHATLGREPSPPESIGPDDMAGAPLPERAADSWDISSVNRDTTLLLEQPHRDRIRTAAVAAAALVASFTLGWTGGLNWHELAITPAPNQVARKETPSPHIADAKPGGKAETTRRAAAATEPAVTGSIPKTPASVSRPPALAASPATASTPSVALATRRPLAPAPETRPSTIPGWSVVEVRDGTAVLEGPNGVRMAARGDVIPGIGRVDSIVRWGDRWIVATASGLIATP
jgi:hypothetical protein